MLKRNISLFALSLFALSLHAQDQSTGSTTSGNNSQQQNGVVDCTDPLMSGSLQCTPENQGRDYGLQPRNENGVPGTLPNGQFPGNATYRDNGSLTQLPNRNQSLRTPIQ